MEIKLAYHHRLCRAGRVFPTECGSRDELKQLGEGQKVTVVARALTARKGSGEKCNCDLTHKEDTDNHIVLVDRNVKDPTLTKDEDRSVTAEFTPRVRLDHPKFTRDTLNHLIDPNWTASQNNANGKLLVRVTGLLMFDSAHFFGGPPGACYQLGDTPGFKVRVLPQRKILPR